MTEIELIVFDLNQTLEHVQSSLESNKGELKEAKSHINDLHFQIKKLEDQVSNREQVRCSRCGTPIEKFFTCPEMTLSEFIKLIRKGKKLEAIKQLKAETNWGLFDSKNLVDRIMDFFKEIEI